MSTQWSQISTFGYESYRTYRLDWTAQPAASPIMVAKAGSVFMSWNGATDVSDWQIYEGVTASTLKLTKTVAKAGFEIKASIADSTKFVQVGAIGGLGHSVLRKSSVVIVS